MQWDVRLRWWQTDLRVPTRRLFISEQNTLLHWFFIPFWLRSGFCPSLTIGHCCAGQRGAHPPPWRRAVSSGSFGLYLYFSKVTMFLFVLVMFSNPLDGSGVSQREIIPQQMETNRGEQKPAVAMLPKLDWFPQVNSMFFSQKICCSLSGSSQT